MRSEGLHYQLLRCSLVISDLFELEIKQESGDVDMDGYAHAVATKNLMAATGDPDSTEISELRAQADTAFGNAEADWEPWRLRSRRVRLITRPVPERIDGKLVVSPHFCFTSAKVLRGYWEAGQLPWVDDDTSDLGKALANVRTLRNLELERQVQAPLETNGWTTAVRIKPGDGARIGVPTITTEIDIVAGRADSETLWILEVKDPAPVFAPPEIRRHLNRFAYDAKSYTVMLGRKSKELEGYASEIAQALGLPSGTYMTAAAFVTREVVPSAFSGGPFPYFTLSSVLDIVGPSSSLDHG